MLPRHHHGPGGVSGPFAASPRAITKKAYTKQHGNHGLAAGKGQMANRQDQLKRALHSHPLDAFQSFMI